MLDGILRRDRAVTLAGLAVLTLVAWAWLLTREPMHAHASVSPEPVAAPAETAGEEVEDSLPP